MGMHLLSINQTHTLCFKAVQFSTLADWQKDNTQLGAIMQGTGAKGMLLGKVVPGGWRYGLLQGVLGLPLLSGLC